MTNWRAKAASAAMTVVLLAVALRLADDLLAPLFPYLLMLGALAAIYLCLLRRR